MDTAVGLAAGRGRRRGGRAAGPALLLLCLLSLQQAGPPVVETHLLTTEWALEKRTKCTKHNKAVSTSVLHFLTGSFISSHHPRRNKLLPIICVSVCVSVSVRDSKHLARALMNSSLSPEIVRLGRRREGRNRPRKYGCLKMLASVTE